MKFTRRKLAQCAVGAIASSELAMREVGLVLAEASAEGSVPNLAMPPVTLRRELHGYGAISATITPQPFRRTSLVQIECDSPASTLLLQAKYLSDLQRLPGVVRTYRSLKDGRRIPAYGFGDDVSGQVACFARHSLVLILATSEHQLPEDLFSTEALQTASAAEFEPRAAVPMYMDRWDRYGLLCYYAPEVMPPGSQYLDQKFDYSSGIRFAQEHETGIVLWTYPLADDFAEGLTSEQAWSWVQKSAREKRIPVHINTQIAPPQIWLANRFPEQTMLKAPQFLGGYYGVGHDSTGQSAISWLSEEAEDQLLAVFQRNVRRFALDSNIVGWLEPHGETYELPQKLFLDSGPYAEEALRSFLRKRYGTLKKLSERWHGDPNRYRSWADVAMPEVANFAGFGPKAIDLRGVWRVRYVPAPDGHLYSRDEARGLASPPPNSGNTPKEWFQPDFDDSGWDELLAPGNDRMLSLARSPLVYRRTVELPSGWQQRGQVASLYVWDMANRDRDVTILTVNGLPIPEVSHGANDQHWSRFDVTAALKPGKNKITLLLPRAIICYRVYLTQEPPLRYPNLGQYRNARWVDLLAWNIESRGAQIRRGAEMIRQAAPHASINFMAANDYTDPVKQSCKDYGGRFHDTGSMAGFWTDENCLLMSGAGLPVTAEPGNGAPNAREFQLFWGRWLTEGVNGVHYFQNWGEIAWNPEVLAVFEANRRMYEAVGKYHAPFAKVGVLFGLQSQWLAGFPWAASDSAGGQGGYYSRWNAANHLLNWCPRDGIGAVDFQGTEIDRYAVIIDTNTAFMDELLLEGIEQYVKRGGVFITYGHTGRHSPTVPDSWPISRLTGFQVVGSYGGGDGKMASTPTETNETLYPHNPVHCSGFRLKSTGAGNNVQTLLQWEDGTTAIGMRRLGKGYIVQFGLDSSGTDFVHWIAPLLLRFHADERVLATATVSRGDRVPHLRHFVGNSGLHNVWVLFNESDEPVTVDLKFMLGHHLNRLTDIVSNRTIQLEQGPSGTVANGIELAKWETRMLVSPHANVAASAGEWISLQYNWWQGVKAPPQKRLPELKEVQRFTLDLTEGWAYHLAPNISDAQAESLLHPDATDAHWERKTLGLTLFTQKEGYKRILIRRKFTVPVHWKDADIYLCADVPYAQFFHETRIFLDGKAWAGGRKSVDGPYLDPMDGVLTPGSTHLLGLDFQSHSNLVGSRGPIWLTCIPRVDTANTQSLAGVWQCWSSPTHRSGEVTLPGTTKAMYVSRTVRIDSAKLRQKKSVFIYYESTGERLNLIVNGHLICHGEQPRQHIFIVNITPLVHQNADNLIELAANSETGEKVVRRVEIRYEDR